MSPTRDFNFVEDTCSAFIVVSKTNKAIGKVINAASNFEVSIANTVKYISEIMNKDVEISLDKNRIRPKLSEVNRLFGDNSLLKEITDWQPKFEGLEGFKRGLKITAEWFKNPENIAFYRAERYLV